METVIHDLESAESIEVSSSMGDLLDVTPVPSVDHDTSQDEVNEHDCHDHSSPSNLLDNDNNDDEDDKVDDSEVVVAADDKDDIEEDDPGDVAYFSSSSEDESDNKRQQAPVRTTGESEWDKALQTGKHSEAKADASDFFAASQDVSEAGQPAAASYPPPHGGQQQQSSSFSVNQALHSDKSYASDASGAPTVTNSAQTMAIYNGRQALLPKDAAASNVNTGRQHHPSSGISIGSSSTSQPPHIYPVDESDVSSGVLPDVLMTMRQKIESSFMGFDSDMMRIASDAATAAADDNYEDDPLLRESRESLKRSSQQSISAAVLVSLAHKRYERRRLAAMEIEKVVRSLVQQNEIGRVRAILLLLSDDYVRSTNEDARKGGVVALAACAIGLKKAKDTDQLVMECRDLVLASVVHCCQCHSQRVRYYATESLFNVVKVMPSMAVQHFFILFEILRSLYADVDVDVRSGAELLDKKLKEVIVKAMNHGTDGFTAEDCIPVFARFVHMRNKATKRLTLSWLQELNEKLVSSPILEFLHLFLGGIFDMIADPSQEIRQPALEFLRSVLSKLIVCESHGADDDKSLVVNFDQVLQSLVSTMEHPDPTVRKVAMYWMSRIVKTHLDGLASKSAESITTEDEGKLHVAELKPDGHLSKAAICIRNTLPRMLPGIFLSIGDDFQPNGMTKGQFLPDQSTRDLADQTNRTLQDAVRRDGQSYIPLLDGFIVALRDELDSPEQLSVRHPSAMDRVPYRMDVVQDGTGIESPGWFNVSRDVKERSDESMILSRLCALHWVIVLYDKVVPVALKADYAREFVVAVIHQLVDKPPEMIVQKSLEVLATITVPVEGEEIGRSFTSSALARPVWLSESSVESEASQFPMTEPSVSYAFSIVEQPRTKQFSRNRDVFSALVQLHAYNEDLVGDLSSLITYMCKMQPPEFVFVSFSVEIDRFLSKGTGLTSSKALRFLSSFVRQMNHVLLSTVEAKPLRDVLQDCICSRTNSERDRQRSRLFHILLHSFSHNLASALTLCFWVGAYRTAHMFLNQVNPLDLNLVFFLDVDRFVELLERPLFRHLHIRMLEDDSDPKCEGSGCMLFQTLKSLLMILPQSTCYMLLKDRLVSVSRFRQSAINVKISRDGAKEEAKDTANPFLDRVLYVRALHCAAAWDAIRADSLELPMPPVPVEDVVDGSNRNEWLGYASNEAAEEAQEAYRRKKTERLSFSVEQVSEGYDDIASIVDKVAEDDRPLLAKEADEAEEKEQAPAWKDYWEQKQADA